MKNPARDSLALTPASLGLLFCLVANPVVAAIQGWDPNGTTSIGGAGVWDTSSLKWTPAGTTTQVASGSLVAFTAGNVALFCAGPSSSGSQGTFTITASGAISMGGIDNGNDAPGACNITINQGTSGSLVLPSATTTFNQAGSACGNTTINIPITGVGPLSVFGCGTLTLGGANTYTGKTIILGANVSVSSLNKVSGGSASSSLGAPTTAANGTISIGSGASDGKLVYTGAGETTDRVIDLAGTTGGAIIENDGTGPIVFTANSTATGAGSKTLTLQGSQGGANTISGIIVDNSGVNKTSVAKAGTGGWVLSGNNTFTGGLTINGSGGISFGHNSAFGSGAVTWSAAGFIQPSDTAAYTIANPQTHLAAGGTETFAGNSGGVTFSGGWTLPTSGTLTLNNIANTITVSGVISGSTPIIAKISSPGVGWTFSGANTYSGKTTIASGSLSVGSLNKVTGGTASSNLGHPTTAANGTIGLGATTTAGTLIYTGAGETTDRVIDLAGTTGGGTIQNDGSGALTFSSAFTASGVGAKTLTLQGANTGANTISGAIVDSSSGATSVTKAQAGTWTLSGANTYTGGTTVSGGVIVANNNSALGGAGNVTVSSGAQVQMPGGFTVSRNLLLNGTGVSNDGALRSTAGANFWGNAITLQANGTRINADSGSTLTLNSSATINASTSGWNVNLGGAGTIVASGIIKHPSGTVTKDGSGTLTLGAANTFSGGVTLNAGQLNINNGASGTTTSSALGVASGTFTIAGNGTCVIDNTSTGSITIGPAIPLAWNASFTFLATKTLAFQGVSPVTLGANVKVTVGGDGSSTFFTVPGVISDGASTFSLTKDGAGWMILSGANTFKGGLKHSGGVLGLNNAAAPGTGTFNIAGDGTGSCVIKNTGGTFTLANNNVQSWNADFTYTGNGANDLNLGTGTVTLGGNLQVTVSDRTLTVGGAIGDGGSGFSLTKAGAGTLTLTGASSTYSGITTVSAGVLSISSDGNLGAAPGSPVANRLTMSGGTLNTTVTFTLNANRGMTLSGTGGTLDVASSTTLTYGGVIAGSVNTAGLTKSSSGTLTLSGANTFGGGTGGDFTVMGGTVNFNNDNAAGAGKIIVTPASNVTLRNSVSATTLANNITLNSSAQVIDIFATSGNALTLNGQISGTGAAQRGNGGGAGTLTLGADNSGWSGGLTHKGGILALGHKSALGTGTLTLSSTFGTGLSSMTLQSSTPLTGASAVANAITADNSPTIGGANDLELSGAMALGSSTKTFTVNNSGATIFSGVISSTGGGLTKTGTGTLTLSGANTYGGDTTISAGTVKLGAAGTIPDGSGKGNVSVTGALDLNTFSETINGLSGAGTVDTVAGGTPTLTAGANDQTSTFSGVIQNTTGTLALTKTGAGTLTLTGANTYTGTTTISAGTLQVGNGGSSGSLGTGSVTDNSALTFNRSGSVTVGNAISGSGSLTQAGSGTLILTGGNSYGATTISTGTLQVGNGGSSGSLGTGSVTDNSALTFNRTDTVTVGNAIGGSGTLTQMGSGTLILGGANTYTGDTRVSSGTLRVNNSLALQNSTADMNGSDSGTLDLNNLSATFGGLKGSRDLALGSGTISIGNNGQSTTYSGALGDAGALTKIGAGTLTLSGANTYSGDTTIGAGTLKLGASGVIPDGAGKGNLSVSGTLDVAGNTETINGLTGGGTVDNSTGNGALTAGGNDQTSTFSGVIRNTSGTLALTKTGGGNQTLSGANTYSGNTTVSAGTLALSGSGSIANTPTISVASAGTLDVTGRSDGTLNLGSAQTLKGNGTVVGVVSVNGTVAAGSSVGTLTNTGSMLLQSGGTNVLEVIDATNAPGLGYDSLNVSGDIGVLSTSGSPFTIKLASLDGTGAAGSVTNFDNDTSYTWTFASAGGSVTNFDASKFTINSDSFSNDLAGGQFVIEPGSLNLRFTNNHAPAAAAATFSRAKNVSLKIRISDLKAAHWSDADGDDTGMTVIDAASTNGATVFTNSTYIFYSNPNNPAVDRFSYTIRDLRNYRAGDTVRTATAHVFINVTNAVGIVSNITVTGSTATVRCAGIPGVGYEIQRSTNLVDWATLETTNAPSAGLFEFTDDFSDLGGPPMSAYYRLRQP